MILRLRNMTAIDATGLRALEDLADQLHATDRELILCGAQPQPAHLMAPGGISSPRRRENICPDIAAALARATELHQHRKQVA